MKSHNIITLLHLGTVFFVVLFAFAACSPHNNDAIEPIDEYVSVESSDDKYLDSFGRRLPSLFLEDSNPIDDYFEEWNVESVGTTMEIRVFAGNYAECWKAEMLHAYDLLLSRAHPTIDEPQESIIRSREAFIEFVESDGLLQAYIENSTAFSDDVQVNGDQILFGTIFPATASFAKAARYRTQTFELYDRLCVIGIVPDFVFNRDELDEIRNLNDN